MRFEREKLYPLAGLDPARAAEYDRVRRLVEKLTYAGNEAARRYLEGTIDAAAGRGVAGAVRAHAPRTAPEQRIRFFDQYRSYVINYNLGQDMVRAYVESRGGTRRPPRRALAGVHEAAGLPPPARRSGRSDDRRAARAAQRANGARWGVWGERTPGYR